MPSIQFFNQQINFTLKGKLQLRRWLAAVAKLEGFNIIELNYIFCSDEFLHQMNVHYLNHDTLTDVITFDNSIIKGEVIGDVFISIERIKENANTYNVAISDELHRVMVHGLLHLCGYEDKSTNAKKRMTENEDYYLKKRKRSMAKN